MALNKRLQDLLDRVRVPHVILPHERAETAMGAARSAHIAGRRLAKVVIVRDRAGTDLMVVLPAHEHYDPEMLRRLSGHEGIQLEDEAALLRRFPDCEVGAMPPFGGLYAMPTYVDRCLAQNTEIFFQAGNHRELVRMRYDDYEYLAQPIVGGICLHATPVAVG